MMGPQAINSHNSRIGVRSGLLLQMDTFDRLWSTLRQRMQGPVLDEPERFAGYTGHRIVTFQDEMGRCALGFYLHKTGDDFYRSITAHRRKLYTDERPRLHYLSDDMRINMKDIRYHNPCDDAKHGHRLGVMAVWVEKYLASEPYPTLPHYTDEIA